MSDTAKPSHECNLHPTARPKVTIAYNVSILRVQVYLHIFNLLLCAHWIKYMLLVINIFGKVLAR
jgi:hypothetical protein